VGRRRLRAHANSLADGRQGKHKLFWISTLGHGAWHNGWIKCCWRRIRGAGAFARGVRTWRALMLSSALADRQCPKKAWRLVWQSTAYAAADTERWRRPARRDGHPDGTRTAGQSYQRPPTRHKRDRGPPGHSGPPGDATPKVAPAVRSRASGVQHQSPNQSLQRTGRGHGSDGTTLGREPVAELRRSAFETSVRPANARPGNPPKKCEVAS
jgi:hypothetical protein